MMVELKRDWRGRVLPKEVKILPNKGWGYFIGLVLGDGYINSDGYKICVESTIPNIVQLYRDSAETLCLHCNYHDWLYNWRGKTRTRYVASVYSKQLYYFFRPLKGNDSHFTIPPLISETRNCLCGFLQGFYDAEGSVYLGPRNKASIEVYSKHASNLTSIQDYLHSLGIKSYLITSKPWLARLAITGYQSRMRFKDFIGFKLESKQAKLEAMPPPQRQRHSREVYLEAMRLRKEEGYTYPQVEAKLGVNANTLAGWTFGKTPREIIMEDYYAKKRGTNIHSS